MHLMSCAIKANREKDMKVLEESFKSNVPKVLGMPEAKSIVKRTLKMAAYKSSLISIEQAMLSGDWKYKLFERCVKSQNFLSEIEFHYEEFLW